jgi:hypothetical protein
MSTHGYQMKWSSFVGTCPASGQLPYELSCLLDWQQERVRNWKLTDLTPIAKPVVAK